MINNAMKIKLNIFFSLLLIAFVFVSCGVEEYYYLPQVPESNVNHSFNIVNINIPDISSYSFARGYSIYYRIYISNRVDIPDNIDSGSVRSSINPNLNYDFNRLEPHTKPDRDTVNVNQLFDSLNYFVLEFDNVNIRLDTNGGNLSLSFPDGVGVNPSATLSSVADGDLRRRQGLFAIGREFFRYHNDLNLNVPGIINSDIERIDNPQRAYVNMYIVARGLNTENFTPVYGKPTHLGIFRLPD